MIVVAPAAWAAITALSPTAPAPVTAKLAPAPTSSARQHRAGAGLDAAAQRAEQLQRRVVADLDGVDLVGDGVGGEGGLGEEPVAQRCAAIGQRQGVGAVGALAGEVDVVEVGAARRGAVEAGSALPARQEAQRDVVAGRDLGDAAAHGLDDAGALVAEHDRQRHRVHLVPDDEVGVAEPGGDDADHDLVRLAEAP